MDVAEARTAMMEVLQTTDADAVAYIDEALLVEYEGDTEDATDTGEVQEADATDAAAGEAAAPRAIFYGNHPVWERRTDRPPYIGVLRYKKGSPNRPNDPCGSNKVHVWCKTTPYGTQYRNCGAFWGYQLTATT